MQTLTELAAAGDRRALAALISRIEADDPGAREMLARLPWPENRALVVGVTGASGTGKSTLVAALARILRDGSAGWPSRRVGIIAVDPTSPFSGGAILGDRIRMRDLAGDEGVFIRSMASRGERGGLSRATHSAVRALDWAGFEVILIETVGVGQDEVEISHLAQTVVVVESPGSGDDIQALKAGILEIADILVVNKADLPGADSTVDSLCAMLELGGGHNDWKPPILKTVARTGEGVDAVVEAVHRHQGYLLRSGEGERREIERAEADLRGRVRDALYERWEIEGRMALDRYGEGGLESLKSWARKVAARECTPERALERLLGDRPSPPHPEEGEKERGTAGD